MKVIGGYVWCLAVVCACAAVGFISADPIHRRDEAKLRVRRVIGGEEVEEGEWPWLVSLQGKMPVFSIFGFPLVRKNYYCGASLLNDRWILTAAHCFDSALVGDGGMDPENWHARLGDIELTSDLWDKVKGVFGDLFGVDDWKDWYIHAKRIIVHPEYDESDYWANDIALVELEEGVPSGEDVPEIQSVTLPIEGDFSFPEDDQPCVMKGWGCTEGGGPVSETARATILPKMNDLDCSIFYGIDTETRLCAGYNLEDSGICPGDSGGPLVCDKDGTWVQVGIASFTAADNPGDVPGAFTRVSSYISWIEETLDRYS